LVYSIAVARHALTQRSKGQRSRSHSYENRAVERLLVTIAGAAYSTIPMLRTAVASVGLSEGTTAYVF